MRRLIVPAVLAAVLLPRAALGAGIDGEWATAGASAKVVVAPCDPAAPDGPRCGTIVWLWQPVDAAGVPLRDAQHPDPARRDRPLLGRAILSGFRQGDAGAWVGGSIYNPEDGRSYSATLTPRGADMLAVEGCVLVFCRAQLWRRAASLCPR